MTAPSSISTEMADLIEQLCLDELSPPDADRLEELIRSDDEACRQYIVFMHMHALAERFEGADVEHEAEMLEARLSNDLHAPTSLPPTAPLLGFLSNATQSTVAYFSQGMPFSYLVAALLVGCGLLISSQIFVSQPAQVARQFPLPSPPSTTHYPLSTTHSIVGRITGMTDCKWADESTAVVGYVAVPLGRKYALASGLLEISYDSGAKVILQGPVTYEVESAAGGFLSVGKLTARVEKKAEGGGRKADNVEPLASPLHFPPSALFSVRTPTATVTDLGTEFGVEVDKSGATNSHVFRGRVELRVTAGKGTGKTVELQENESARVEFGQDQILTVTREVVSATTFPRQLPKRVPIRLFNTGQGWVEGSPDPHWQVVGVSNITPSIRSRPALVTSVWEGPWMANEFHRSQWISTVNGGLVVDQVTYTFRTTFNLAGLRPETARLQGEFVVDNHVRAIRLNGQSVPVPKHGYELFQCWHPFTVSSGFTDGVNVLEFDVDNGFPGTSPKKGSRMGIQVRLRGSADRSEGEI